MTSHLPSYHGYRFPPDIISHAVWLYHRFGLSFRDVEDLRSGRPGSLLTLAPHRSGRAGCRDRSWARAPVGEE